MAERDAREAPLAREAVQRAAAQPAAQPALRAALGDHAPHDGVGVLLDDVVRHAERLEVVGQHVLREARLLLVEVHGAELETTPAPRAAATAACRAACRNPCRRTGRPSRGRPPRSCRKSAIALPTRPRMRAESRRKFAEVSVAAGNHAGILGFGEVLALQVTQERRRGQRPAGRVLHELRHAEARAHRMHALAQPCEQAAELPRGDLGLDARLLLADRLPELAGDDRADAVRRESARMSRSPSGCPAGSPRGRSPARARAGRRTACSRPRAGPSPRARPTAAAARARSASRCASGR